MYSYIGGASYILQAGARITHRLRRRCFQPSGNMQQVREKEFIASCVCIISVMLLNLSSPCHRLLQRLRELQWSLALALRYSELSQTHTVGNNLFTVQVTWPHHLQLKDTAESAGATNEEDCVRGQKN